MAMLFANRAQVVAQFLIEQLNFSAGISARRLIAPKCTIEGQSIGWDYSIEGRYWIKDRYIDEDNLAVYSVDMVRLEFDSVSDKAVMNYLDQTMIFNNLDTFTSNNIGKYRFMWVYDYADGMHGGKMYFRDGTVLEDGTKGVRVKVGYLVNVRGGVSKRGFVEFNPNKCGWNARRLIKGLYDVGCDFQLVRYDIAIDVPVKRDCIRLVRDRRKYEYVISNGGPTEYLGSRNSPGRVKVYDKACELGLQEIDLTRIELTTDCSWGIDDILAKLPNCVDYGKLDLTGVSAPVEVVFRMIDDVLTDLDGIGASEEVKQKLVVQKYLGMLPHNTASRVRKLLKSSKKMVRYNRKALRFCRDIARSYEKVQI